MHRGIAEKDKPLDDNIRHYNPSKYWKKKHTRLGTIRLYEGCGGLKAEGQFYLYCQILADMHQDPLVSVDEDVFNSYMRDIWREEKAAERRTRCWLGNRRCKDNCSECYRERNLFIDSIQRLDEIGPWETGNEIKI